MRGDLQFISKKTRERDKLLSTPWDPQKGDQHVEDACSVGDVGIVAYDKGPQQILLIEGTKGVPLTATPHRLGQLKRGVSCLSPVDQGQAGVRFVSGGHDHTVQLWTVSPTTHETEVRKLAIHNSSVVHALVHCRAKKQTIAASNFTAILFDFEQGKEVKRGLSSNTIHRMHIHPNQSQIVATEVKHLDRQVNIYDLRMGFFNKKPQIEFGYRDKGSAPGTRYQCGDFKGSLFVRGFHDGTIKLFDIRNAKRDVATTALTRRAQGVAQSLFWTGSSVLAFGETMLSILDFEYVGNRENRLA
ncbi:hypothetical protein K439DRAFT_16684 [Ramaria rubella]|nr:hypothetical protein K439DRAFT_16684 [Ramaria rubella]